MTAPAQAPTDQPAPATPDQLAALYLRARDVPCPGCGYNRRDGGRAACPECGQWVALGVRAPGMLESPTRRVRRLMYLIISVSLLGLLAYLASMIAYAVMMNTTSFLANFSIINFVYFGAYIAGAAITIVFAAKTLRRIAGLNTNADKSMRQAVFFFAFTLVPGLAWSLFVSIGHIIDSL